MIKSVQEDIFFMSFSLELDCLFWRLNFTKLLKNRLNDSFWNNFQPLCVAMQTCTVTVIENLPKSLQLHLHYRNSSEADFKLQFGLTFFSVGSSWLTWWSDGCSRTAVLVNDWHVIGSFELFCSSTKKFSSASILCTTKYLLKYSNSKVSSLPMTYCGSFKGFYHFYNTIKGAISDRKFYWQ